MGFVDEIKEIAIDNEKKLKTKEELAYECDEYIKKWIDSKAEELLQGVKNDLKEKASELRFSDSGGVKSISVYKCLSLSDWAIQSELCQGAKEYLVSNYIKIPSSVLFTIGDTFFTSMLSCTNGCDDYFMLSYTNGSCRNVKKYEIKCDGINCDVIRQSDVYEWDSIFETTVCTYVKARFSFANIMEYYIDIIKSKAKYDNIEINPKISVSYYESREHYRNSKSLTKSKTKSGIINSFVNSGDVLKYYKGSSLHSRVLATRADFYVSPCIECVVYLE